jgi:hypothetical protein
VPLGPHKTVLTMRDKVHLGMQAKGFDDSKGRDPPDRPEG